MTENELLFQISSIVNGHVIFHQAVEQIALLLEREAGGKALIVDLPNQELSPVHLASPSVGKFLDSLDVPYRSLFSVPLKDGGVELGKALVCFASDEFQGDLPQRLAEFVGEQLGMLLWRTQVTERNAQLRREIAKIEEDLATRKVLQRAEGVLIAQRGMKPDAAKRWIEQQSHKTGLSLQDVADRVVAYHQATGLLEQRIA